MPFSSKWLAGRTINFSCGSEPNYLAANAILSAVESLKKYLSYNPVRRIQISTLIWFSLALIAVLIELNRGTINNYLIFKNVFWHIWHQQNLYAHYPAEYNDLNHYGPFFSIIILPFAILPDWLGVILWAMFNTWILFYAIQVLPITEKSKNIVLLISAIEMMTSIHNVQFNTTTAAWIILSWFYTQRNNSALATLLIIAGFLIKLYGIVGISFFFFSKDKKKFAGFLILWFVIISLLPALISSLPYIIHSYFDWFRAIVDKNAVNIRTDSIGIDISISGVIRRVLNLPDFVSWYVILPAIVMTLLPLFFRQYYDLPFQLKFLSLLLISVCIFSSSAESPTYVIAVTGIAIWYAVSSENKSTWEWILLLLVIIFTSLSPTDLFPGYIRKRWIQPYSLKALPCFLVWLKIISELMTGGQSLKFKSIFYENR